MKHDGKKDILELEEFLEKWIDRSDYKNVYQKIDGEWSKDKAKNIVKLIKIKYGIK